MMHSGFAVALKSLAILAASATSGAVATEVYKHSERIILGVPQSWFLAAVVGTLICVVFLKEVDAGRIAPAAAGTPAARWFALLLRVAFLGFFVLGFALIASWIVVGAGIFMPAFKEGGVVFSGLSGLAIWPMLPHYLAALQKFTDRLAGRTGAQA